LKHDAQISFAHRAADTPRLQTLLSEFGITCSMRGRGGVWDNSEMDSSCSSLRTERTSRAKYRSR